MKNNLFFFSVLSLWFLSNQGLAQIVGGSKDNLPVAPAEKKVVKENVNGVLRNRFYFAGSLIRPLGTYGDGVPNSDQVSALQGSEHLGFGWGLGGDLGMYIYFHKLPLNENMRLGIDLCLGDLVLQPHKILNTNFFRIGGGLGPIATMKVFNKIMLDCSFTLRPVIWFPGEEFSYDNVYSDAFFLQSEFRLRKNLNFQIRLNKFLMGLQFDFGRREGITTRSYYFSNDNGTDFQTVESDFSYRFRANVMKLRFGFAF